MGKSRLFVAPLLLGCCLTEVQGQVREELIAPIVANGIDENPHFQTTLRLVELAGTTVRARMIAVPQVAGGGAEFFCDPGGSPPAFAPTVLREFSVGPLGAVNLSSSGVSPVFFTGWARIELDQPDAVAAAVEVSLIGARPSGCPPPGINICSRPSTEVISSVQIPAVKPARRFRAQVIITPNRHTAFALVNPSRTEAASVDLRLLNADGEVELVQEGDLSAEVARILRLDPLESVRGFVWNLLEPALPNCSICPGPPRFVPPPGMFHGSILITSDAPIAVAGLHVLLPEGKLTNVPVEASP